MARGFIETEETAELAVTRPLDGVTDPAVLKYAQQLRQLLGDDRTLRDPTVALRPDVVELRPDGSIDGHSAPLWEIVEKPQLARAWLTARR